MTSQNTDLGFNKAFLIALLSSIPQIAHEKFKEELHALQNYFGVGELALHECKFLPVDEHSNDFKVKNPEHFMKFVEEIKEKI